MKHVATIFWNNDKRESLIGIIYCENDKPTKLFIDKKLAHSWENENDASMFNNSYQDKMTHPNPTKEVIEQLVNIATKYGLVETVLPSKIEIIKNDPT